MHKPRSSIAMRLSSITHVGGVNSIENFARSLTRATGFHEINPRQPAFILADDGPEEGPEDDLEYGSVRTESGHFPRAGLSKQNLDNDSPENAVDDQSVVGTPPRFIHRKSSDIDHRISDVGSLPGSMRGGQSIFAIAPHLGTPLAGSYGASYGTLRSNLNESSMAHAGQLWKQQQAAGANALDGEHMPLIVKEVEQDGKIVYVVEGQSTLYQTGKHACVYSHS
jgi:vesicular inhibitory amino acid transporter